MFDEYVTWPFMRYRSRAEPDVASMGTGAGSDHQQSRAAGNAGSLVDLEAIVAELSKIRNPA